ncbi:MAG: hypothetical protein methR_P0016 [Methyloprofundus sp.]|nr:MAG: hypothetical protein methR_P0016 [Methyloprofundus sp.]
MMKLIVSTSLLMLLLLSGCGSSSDDSASSPQTVKVYLEPKDITLVVDTSEKFTAFASDINNNTTDVTNQAVWSLEKNDGTVQLDASNPSLIRALAQGQDRVTASFDGVSSAAATVTVIDDVLVTLVVSPSNVDMAVGTSQEFKVEGTFASGLKADLTDESLWQTNSPTIVSIDKNVATANKESTDLGSNISATFDGISGVANIISYDVIERLEIHPQDKTELFVGDVQKYDAFAYFASSTDPQPVSKNVGWRSDTLSVLDTTALPGQYVARGEGTATISAEYTYPTTGESLTETKLITVHAFFLDRIEISPENSSMSVGEIKRYRVLAIDSKGDDYPVDDQDSLKMSVSDPNLAYIVKDENNQWMLTAIAAGPVQVKAEYFDITNGQQLLADTLLDISEF